MRIALMSCILGAAVSLACSADEVSPAAMRSSVLPMGMIVSDKLSCRQGTLSLGPDGLRISGVSQASGRTCVTGSVQFSRPLEVSSRMVRFVVSSPTPSCLWNFRVRCYDSAGAVPVWSFFQGGPHFVSTHSRSFTVELSDGYGVPLSWDRAGVSGLFSGTVSRFEFEFEVRGSSLPFEVLLSDFSVVPLSASPLYMRWSPVPVYSDHVSSVCHPAGSVTSSDLARARRNMRLPAYSSVVSRLRRRAGYWMRFRSSELPLMIPSEDAWFKCLCPHCGTQPEFAWSGGKVLQADLRSIRCTKCGMVFPNERYPETSSYTVRTPRGKVKTIRYYHGKDQLAQGENYGPRYHLTGAVNYVKLRQLEYIYDTALMYALEGDLSYARRVREVLVRFAQVYPDYSIKFRATAYASPRDHYMGGKWCAWKFHDSSQLPRLLNAYCLTHDSGVYSQADKLAIENGICREFKWMITAHPPTQDWCQNAVPAHLTTAALCASILGDHELMDWVLKGEHGFLNFLKRYYHRDGHWHENAPSYANMATGPMIDLVCALHGYSDAPEYKGADRYDHFDVFQAAPTLKLIFSGMAAGMLPTGCLPAVNDSAMACRQNVGQLDMLVALQPTDELRRLRRYQLKQLPQTAGGSLAMMKREEDDDGTEVEPPEDFTRSLLYPGGGWALMRRPQGFRQNGLMLYFGGDVGGHSHNCTLNFLYCDFAKEVVSDLGYLSWWHDNRTWNNSTFAHNLVVVDGKAQRKSRRGVPEWFTGGQGILSARFSAPTAYPGITDAYDRTLFCIPLRGARQYLVDFFTVRGGKEQVWTFHADGEGFTPPQGLAFRPTTLVAEKETGVDWLKKLQGTQVTPGTYHSHWQYDAKTVTSHFFLPGKKMELLRAEAPGLRNQKTPYLKVKLNLLLARAQGPENTFASVLETHQGKPQVTMAEQLKLRAGSRPATAVRVRLKDGGEDVIVLAGPGQGTVRLEDYQNLEMDAGAAVIRFNDKKKLRGLWCVDGKVEAEGRKLDAGPALKGKILAVDEKKRVLRTDLKTVPIAMQGNQYLVIPRRYDGAYRYTDIRQENGQALIQLHPQEVLRLEAGDEFTICPYAEIP